MTKPKADKIWLDGKLIDWEKANVHVLTHTLHYGFGVFEGVRAYECHDGRTAIFKLKEHTKRLFDSAKINLIDIPFSQEEICQATIEVVRENKLKSCYIRPLVFLGDEEMGLYALNNPVRVAIAAWSWGPYLGKEAIENGIRAKVSSFTRVGINSILTKAKTCGNYINSIWAKREALKAGYEEAIMLDAQGYVCEATGENIFMVHDGVVRTPALGSSILKGITRECIIHLLKKEGLEVIEQSITRDELYVADEVFLCGTAAEITPIRELDDRQIGLGKPGPITQKVQTDYFDLIRGKFPEYHDWLSFVS